MSIICESGIGHAAGDAAENAITIILQGRIGIALAKTIGWVAHELIVEPIIDSVICYPQKSYDFIFDPISEFKNLAYNIKSVYDNYTFSAGNFIKMTLPFLSIAVFTHYTYNILYNQDNPIISLAKLIPINMIGSYIINETFAKVFEGSIDKVNVEVLQNINSYVLKEDHSKEIIQLTIETITNDTHHLSQEEIVKIDDSNTGSAAFLVDIEVPLY